jgi:hypothetical protein
VGPAKEYTWKASTTDVRALQNVNGTSRIAATVYAHAMEMNLQFSDSQTHRVALYVVDWDRGGRRQAVEIVNATTGAVLDRRTLSDYSGGQYLVWTVSGNIKVKLSTLQGPNAVVSGVFVD